MKNLLRRWYTWRIERIKLKQARTATRRMIVEQIAYARHVKDIRASDFYHLRQLYRTEDKCSIQLINLLDKLNNLNNS